MSLDTFRQSVSHFVTLTEDLAFHRRDLFSRLERRTREKLDKPVRDVLRARRERMQRNRRHRLKNVKTGAPTTYLSTHFRYR